jgi:nicotinamidase-related amidase
MTAALLVMDVQTGIVARYRESEGYLSAMAQAVAAARSARVSVVFVRIAFRSGYPEVSARNRSFSALKAAADAFIESSPATQIHRAVAPQANEPVVLKKRVSAFSGSDLEVVLRAAGATRLALAGIATSGVVLSTLREAADQDYELVVLSDACFDPDDEVQRVLMQKVFPRQAEVLSVAQWKATLKDSSEDRVPGLRSSGPADHTPQLGGAGS